MKTIEVSETGIGAITIIALILIFSAIADAQTTAKPPCPTGQIQLGNQCYQRTSDKDVIEIGPHVPAGEASFGLEFVPLVHTTPSYPETFVYPEGARQGFYASLGKPLNDVVGLQVEASRTTGRFVDIAGKRVYSTQVVGGLRFSDREISKNFIPYFETMLGTSHRPYLLSHSGNHLEMELTVGGNVFVSKHFGFNVSAAYESDFRDRQWEQASFKGGIAIR